MPSNDDRLTTWRKQLKEAGVTEWEAVAPSEMVLDVEFDCGYGGSNGPEFLVWTATHVWFPVVYDGAEWVGSAPRDPQAEGQAHVGGQ